MLRPSTIDLDIDNVKEKVQDKEGTYNVFHVESRDYDSWTHYIVNGRSFLASVAVLTGKTITIEVESSEMLNIILVIQTFYT